MSLGTAVSSTAAASALTTSGMTKPVLCRSCAPAGPAALLLTSLCVAMPCSSRRILKNAISAAGLRGS